MARLLYKINYFSTTHKNNKSMYTPKHFKLIEFTHSATAERLNIDNTPTFEVVDNITRLCMLVLDTARDMFGKPIIITSGYRSERLNKSVGGVSTSQHLQGLACDIVVNDMDKLFNILKHNPHIDQLLYETNGKSKWLHVSIAKRGNTPRRYINSNYMGIKKGAFAPLTIQYIHPVVKHHILGLVHSLAF